LAISIRSPSSIGAPWPGSSSMNMSFSPVFGRSSAVESLRRSPLKRFSISSVTTARPSSSSTSPMSPIFTPATRTDWPCPGATARAFSSTASTRNGPSSTIGKRKFCWDRM
jgi:hypothetical protein